MSATNVRETIKSRNLYFGWQRIAVIFDVKALQKEGADQKHQIFDDGEI